MKLATYICVALFASLLVLPILGMTNMTSYADDWYEAEEASCLDFAAVSGIKMQAERTDKTAQFTPGAEVSEEKNVGLQTAMLDRESIQRTIAFQFSAPVVRMDEPVDTGHWFTMPGGCAGDDTQVWIGPGDSDPVITCVPICFGGLTQVATDKGIKYISEIMPGEMVLGKDGFSEVLEVQVSEGKPELEINGIKATPNHPFIMADGEIRPAGELAPGDMLFNGKMVESVTPVPTEENSYNLIVRSGTYYVGDMLVSSAVDDHAK
ncbi:MAG: Hint domain-containing protein [Candidatus Omnitrophica bacterium]|nr:Hint domain-containing protein [Candidatus Omnitrophota bacterium]MDD5488435.1 Hint domain-containing protein [Candidatus Omnitrophota bacterium]